MRECENLRLEGDECIHGLTGKLVCSTNNSCLSDTLVEDEGRFNLSGRETMARDVDDIYGKNNEHYSGIRNIERHTVNTALNPDVAMLVASGAISVWP